jgi:hypothetical protein
MKGEAVKRLTAERVEAFGFAPDVALAMEANRAVSQALGEQIEALERRLKERGRLRPETTGAVRVCRNEGGWRCCTVNAIPFAAIWCCP